MDLVLISSGADAVAVAANTCYNCFEKKLNTKILKVFKNSLTKKEFLEWKNEYGLEGYMIECQCNNFRSIHSEKIE
jgi:hypothetical protein